MRFEPDNPPPAWCTSCRDFVGHKVDACPNVVPAIFLPTSPADQLADIYGFLMRSPRVLKTDDLHHYFRPGVIYGSTRNSK